MDKQRSGADAGKGNMERIGENVGAGAGRALDTAADLAGKVAGAAGSAASAAADMARQAAGTAAGLAGEAASGAAEATATLVGNVADRLGGWWSDRGVHEAAKFEGSGERACREHFDAARDRAGRDYEAVRPLYALGHVAARNPDYRGSGFDAAEPELERAWHGENARRFGEWSNVRGFVGAGFAVSGGAGEAAGGRDPGSRAAASRGGSVDLGAASGGAGVGFRGHSGGGARDSESTRFGNSGSTADGTTGTRDASAPDSRGSL